MASPGVVSCEAISGRMIRRTLRMVWCQIGPGGHWQARLPCREEDGSLSAFHVEQIRLDDGDSSGAFLGRQGVLVICLGTEFQGFHFLLELISQQPGENGDRVRRFVEGDQPPAC